MALPLFAQNPAQPFLANPRRKYLARLGLALGLGSCLFMQPSLGQTKRCDLVGRDTTLVPNGTKFKSCLDLTKLNGKTIVVPGNVTRIDNDGLSLCKSSVKTGGDVDIVYAYDNSNSMTADWALVTGADTVYFEFQKGSLKCNDLANGNVTFDVWDALGQNRIKKTIPRLNSNRNCAGKAGDPFNDRARALYQAIGQQASRSPLSSAGILSFANAVGQNKSLPLILDNETNLNLIRNKINAAKAGGTAYSAPLDTAAKWLSPTFSKNPKKAVIFISDGRPKDDPGGLVVIPPSLKDKAHPVYGIFLGSELADTVALDTISRITGGKFYKVPAGRPDSLKTVVDAILDIILKEYVPVSATVTNTSLSPVQIGQSASSDFSMQLDGSSWLMKLNNVIALKPGSANSITLSSTFEETVSKTLETSTTTFTINTTGANSGVSQKIDSTQIAINCYDGSSLRILNAAGARPAFLTSSDIQYQIRLRTNDTLLNTATSSASTRFKNDAEAPTLSTPTRSGDSLVFQKPYDFKVENILPKTDGNNILESALYDSVVVTWTHPRDSQDKASDTVPVRVPGKTATAYFSLTNGGPPITGFYPATTPTVYVVIKDQARDPRKTYTAKISSDKFSIDEETVALTESPDASGTFLGQIHVDNSTKNSGDKNLQVSLVGDQLKVVYVDPVDKDTAIGAAGFSIAVQEIASLQFSDEAGTTLPSDAIWSPAKGKLYLTYYDDSASGSVTTKKVRLSLANKKSGNIISSDKETVTLNLTSDLNGSRAVWKGSIDLTDAFPSIESNGNVEARYRGEASIVVNSHNNIGVDDPETVSDALVIAYPDSVASLQWKMVDPATVPSGTEGLVFTVKDQDFTLATNDSLPLTITCTKSGDSVSGFFARESSALTYLTSTLIKDENAPNLNDRILSCLTTDQLLITYLDPVYGTKTELIINEVAKPDATPASKAFITSELISLTTSTPGAQIYYTLDGSTPIPGTSPLFTNPIKVTRTTVIKAIASRVEWKNSKVLTQTYTKTPVASRLEILDQDGNQIPDGIITGASKGLKVKLITTQADLLGVTAAAITKNLGDAENINLGEFGFLGDAFEYSGNMALEHPTAKKSGNDTINATGTDTLIVRWENLLNPADIAVDTVIIKPAFVAAEVYFSTSEGGAKVGSYPKTQDSIFIVVKTRPRDASLSYTVLVTSEKGTDQETLTLKELSPGIFSAKAKVSTVAKTLGDKILQVAAGGDQLKAVFEDPVYKDKYEGNVGFDQQVQESAGLEFVDAAGNLIAPNDIWSPEKGKIYLRFSDDWNAVINPLVLTKSAKLTLINKKYGEVIGTDDENLVLTLDGTPTGTRGTWKGESKLLDKSPAKKGNDTLETFYRGELKASVKPHDNEGGEGGPNVEDNLVIAYPNQAAEIIIQDSLGNAVKRETNKVKITIRDQVFTKSGINSVLATARCTQSTDQVSNVKLTWNGSEFVTNPLLIKGEQTTPSVDMNDEILRCLDSDVLLVTYIDPVYGDPRAAEVKWSDNPKGRLFYANAKDSIVTSSANDATSTSFLVMVEGKSPRRDSVDIISVLLTTDQGDKETIMAVETGAFTGKFIAKVDYNFQSGTPTPNNKKIEGQIILANRVNQVIVKGESEIGSEKVMANLTLSSNYNLISKAYIKDLNENGRADHVYLVFDHKLAALPTSLDSVYWNKVSPKFSKKADSTMLSFLPGSDSSIVVANFQKAEFDSNLTKIALGEKPFAVLPNTNIFAGQRPLLSDSVGVVMVTAMKRPSSLQSYNYAGTEKRFYPDTLIITISEEIQTTGSTFKDMLRFSKGCAEYSASVPLKTFAEPVKSMDGLTWTVLVDNAPNTKSPLVKDCMYLEKDGRYVDLQGNRPGQPKVEVTGENPKLVIRDFAGFPPVAGSTPTSPSFALITDGNGVEQTFIDGTGKSNSTIFWIPPYRYKESDSDPMRTQMEIAKNFTNPSNQNREAEAIQPTPFPTGIGAVLVVASGAYKAQIHIYDNLGHFVRYLEQAYGMNGEDKNPARAVKGGQASWLIWDLKDKNGQLAGQGVYVWKVNFTFVEKNKKSEVRFTRTGVMRQ